MNWPVYFQDQLILGNPDSNVGIITLWTPKDTISNELDRDKFRVCGQLYTKRGVNFIVRNVLANPKIRYLVMCGVDRQGSGDSLTKLFDKGVKQVEDGRWQVAGDDECYIDGEISIEAIQLFRSSVNLIDLRDKSIGDIKKAISRVEPLSEFSKPMYFDDPVKNTVMTYPSDLSVFKIRREKIGECWIDALNIVNRFGIEVPGMYGKVKQVHNLSIVVEDENTSKPCIFDYFTFKKTGLTRYYKGFFDLNSSKQESYTYGERIFNWDGIDQEEIMTEKLTRFPYDRGAMAVLWKPHVDNYPPKKAIVKKDGQTAGWRVPCLAMISAQCMGEKLYMTAVFRNNDIYGAWPLNAFALRRLQENLAKKIGKTVGPLTTISQIAEIHEMDWDNSSGVVATNNSIARTCQFDTRSYYTVKVVKKEILVTFYTPNGSAVLAEYKVDGRKKKVARDLCAEILKDMLIENLGAAADLGRQLAKAETAVKLGLEFQQDKELKLKG